MKTPSIRNSISRPPLRRGVLLIPLSLALAWFALAPTARAVDPPPDGGYPGNNTAEGEDALFSLTTGSENTAIGFHALYSNTTGGEFGGNTAVGSSALYRNTAGDANTAIGFHALYSNRISNSNTANGCSALEFNTDGFYNTANGAFALQFNTTGFENTASGYGALPNNSTGFHNTANGSYALNSNTTGINNTANGFAALINNITGNNNIALGDSAGSALTTGKNNIDIGNRGVAAEANTIRIGNVGNQTATFMAGISGATVAGGVGVIVDASGHLGTVVSSARFKDAIKPMDKASEAILALQPVTFRYKHELDPKDIPQFGLVAEQVEKVNPALVARDDQGNVYTVRYEAVNAMLLNEFLKEHRKVQEQEAAITQLKSTVGKQEATIAQQQKGMEVLAASLKEQGSQIQKVSDQLELRKPAPQTVANNQ